ncbi:MAG: TetR/AcrR family transcriptional regulator [Coprobacillaceae bacterium]
MSKRDLILDALQELLYEGKAGTASVMDIARKAGIAKGGMYYYFKSKEEALDALAYRQYEKVILNCKVTLDKSNDDALTKFKLLLYIYRNTIVEASVDDFLHQTQNAAIHQKSMADIVLGLRPIVSDILKQGNEEGVFTCENCDNYAEVILSTLVFLFDKGVFTWSNEEVISKIKSFSIFLENGLCATKGSFSFLYQGWSNQKLTTT